MENKSGSDGVFPPYLPVHFYFPWGKVGREWEVGEGPDKPEISNAGEVQSFTHLTSFSMEMYLGLN